MTMFHEQRPGRSRDPRSRPGQSRTTPPRSAQIVSLLLAGLLGAAAPTLASCGTSGAGLIPAQNAGPLQSDFDAVAHAAEKGNGSCVVTEEAILKTEQDFQALPSALDTGLRNRLREGISKLHSDALELCRQPVAQTTATSTPPKTTTSTTTSTPTVTQTTTTPLTGPTTTPTTSGPGGGTPAPGSQGDEASPGGGSEQGGGVGGPGADGGGAGGAGAGGQEGGR